MSRPAARVRRRPPERSSPLPGTSRQTTTAAPSYSRADRGGAIDQMIEDEEAHELSILEKNNLILRHEERRSGVWRYFELKPHAEKDWLMAHCSLCRAVLKYCNGTGNLRNHLMGNIHNMTRADLTRESGSGAVLPYAPNIRNGRNIDGALSKQLLHAYDRSITHWYAVDGIAFHQTASEEAKRHAKLTTSYELPCDTVMNRVLNELYEETKSDLKEHLKDSQIALTCDGWSSFRHKYIGITVHYIKDGQRFNGLLCCRALTVQTADEVTAFVRAVCDEFGIDIATQVSSITTDNAAAMRLSQQQLNASFEVGCFAHLLNLATKDCEDILIDALTKLKAIVNHFRNVKAANELLLEKQRAAHPEDEPLTLLQSCDTRWMSTYTMIERYLAIRHHVLAVVLEQRTDENDTEHILNEPQIKALLSAKQALKHVNDALQLISGENATGGLAYVVATALIAKKNQCVNAALNETGKSFCRNLFDKLRIRLHPFITEQQYKIAALLDPHYKQYAFHSEDIKGAAIQALNRELTAAMEADGHPTEEQQAPQLQDPDGLLNYINVAMANASRTLPAEQIINDYLTAYPVLSREHCPWTFWKNYPNPHLKKLAFKYLIICPTSINSERLFSAAGQVVYDTTNRILPGKVDKVLMVKKNKHVSRVV